MYSIPDISRACRGFVSNTGQCVIRATAIDQ